MDKEYIRSRERYNMQNREKYSVMAIQIRNCKE